MPLLTENFLFFLETCIFFNVVLYGSKEPLTASISLDALIFLKLFGSEIVLIPSIQKKPDEIVVIPSPNTSLSKIAGCPASEPGHLYLPSLRNLRISTVPFPVIVNTVSSEFKDHLMFLLNFPVDFASACTGKVSITPAAIHNASVITYFFILILLSPFYVGQLIALSVLLQ